MKKIWMMLVALVGLFALAGCDREPKSVDGWEKFREGYAHTAEAVTVSQEIEVLRGELAVYLYEKEYEKTDSGYSVTSTEKRLNKVDENTTEPYTVTTDTATAAAAETFNASLVLRADVFADYELLEESFRGKIRAGMEDEVFGLTGEHAGMYDTVLTLTLGDDGLTALTVDFRSGAYSVSILLSFTY